MSAPIVDALDDYARRLVTDMVDAMPHVIFLVAVNGTDAPVLHAVARDGRVYPFADMGVSTAPTESQRPAAWTFADMGDASTMLEDVRRAITRGYNRLSPPDAVAEATARRQRHSDNVMVEAMKKAAYEEAHPFLCVCGERWKSERGFRQHQRACLRVKPGLHEERTAQ